MCEIKPNLDNKREQNEENQVEENEPKQWPKFYNFFEMSPEQISHLEKRLEAASGTVIVAVHPFYDRLLGNVVHPHKEKENERIQRVLSRLINKDIEGRPPILLMEEINKIEAAQKLILESASDDNGEVYVVPTVTDHGIPIKDATQDIPCHLWGGYEFVQREQQYWDIFLDTITRMGVKKAIVGGTNLKVIGKLDSLNKLHHADFLRQRSDDGTTNTDYKVAACVGTVLVQLARRINVELSIFSAPYNNAIIKHIEKEGRSGFEKQADLIIDDLVRSIEKSNYDDNINNMEISVLISSDLISIAMNMSEDKEIQNLWIQYFYVKMLGKIADATGKYIQEFNKEVACLADEIKELGNNIDTYFWAQQVYKISKLTNNK